MNNNIDESEVESIIARRFLLMRKEAGQVLVMFSSRIGNISSDSKRFIAIGVDLLTVLIALMFALILRMNTIDLEQYWPAYLCVPVMTVLLFKGLGVYGVVVRHSGIEELNPLLIGVVLSAFMVLVFLYLLRPDPNPRSLFVIYGFMLLVFTLATRHTWKSLVSDRRAGLGAPIAIYGAGALGRQVMQICKNGTDYHPILWLDDDPKYHKRVLANAKVLDPKHPATPDVLKAHRVETILMAIPSIGASRMKQVLESLQAFNCKVKTLPSIDDIMSNRVTSRDAKPLPMEEILGRQPVKPVAALMAKNVTGKVVMVTGAGGSVGSELCRQILPLKPAALILFDVSEAAIYVIDQELQILSQSPELNSPIVPIIGNVVHKRHVSHIIVKHGVNTIYHAAAYKHVPMVESNPQSAIRTNIFGSLAVIEAAIENNVDNFLLVSTDKAVRPTNIMGATKRVAEMIVQAKAVSSNDTCISMVRFGNVLASSGSVVPKFSAQIESGGPITVTHKDIVRYFMTIPEAAQLVIQASSLAKCGDLFVLDMGKPVQIVDLAKSLVYLFGKTLKNSENPNGDIEIVYTGLRDGEKLYEELLIDEGATPTRHPKISRAREEYIPWANLESILAQFQKEMADDLDSNMVESLKNVVVGYNPKRPASSVVSGMPLPRSVA